jgi:hypothetical protein
MLDRTVDLEDVIKAGQRGSGAAGPEVTSSHPPIAATRPRNSVATQQSALPPGGSAVPPAAPQPRSPAAPPDTTAKLAPSLEAIRAGWPAIVVAGRIQSRILGELLASVDPSELAIPWLTVTLREPNQLFAERLTQEAPKVEEILTRSLGQPVRLRVAMPSTEASPPPPRRMSDSSIKADRLREFRSKDPALDRAADALDLEIVD